ncbi:MAG: STM3941 family protein, partial [Bacteroidota bacterium]
MTSGSAAGGAARGGAAAGGPDRLEVPRDKRRPARFLVVAVLGFLAAAASVATLGEGRTGLPLLLHSLALMASVFFVFSAFAMLRRLAFRPPGLVLDAEGIIDRSSDMGAGRVRWDEITEIRVTQSAGRRFLTVIVR